MADKDVEGIAGILFPAVRGVTLVTVSSPRAATWQELARRGLYLFRGVCLRLTLLCD